MTRHRSSFLRCAVRHAFLIATSIALVAPFVWMVALSLKPPGEIFGSGFTLLPQQWHARENYEAALSAAPIGRFLLNGILVCAIIVMLQIVVCAPAAYLLAKWQFAGQRVLFAFVLFALLLPHQVLALPTFVMLWQLRLLDTYVALIAPFAVSPFCIFLFRQVFKAIPDDVVHAARLDGVSELGIVFRILLPMAMPAVIAFACLSVISRWNDLFWPSIAIRSEHLMPPPLGVIALRNAEAASEFGPLMAGATIIVLPLVAVFVATQKWVVEGLTIERRR